VPWTDTIIGLVSIAFAGGAAWFIVYYGGGFQADVGKAKAQELM
jgi:hypothetical protein